MARFAIYLRRSSPGDEDKNYSIETQQLDIEQRWVDYSQHQLVKRYTDPGGTSYTLARPVLQSMMADAKARLFDIVVVGRWDRFSRVQDQQAVAVHQLKQYGVEVISATEPIPDGPIGTLIRNNYAFAAEMELYNLRERTYGGKKRRIKNGKLPGQPGPLYGYLFGDETKAFYVIDPETAPTVRYIFSLFFSGMKLRAISRRLFDEGVVPPSAIWAKRGLSKGRGVADTWNHTTLYKMLTNRAYIGHYVGFLRKTEVVEITNPITKEIEAITRQVIREEDDPDRVVFDENVSPPLIEEGVFYAVQDLLRRNKEESPRRMHSPESCLLRNGFARCGYCGGYMVVSFANATNSYRYHCTKRGHGGCPGGRFSWLASELDDITWRVIIAQFERPEILRAKFEAWKVDNAEGRSIESDRLEAIEAQIEVADKRRRNNMALAADEDDPDQREEYRHLASVEVNRIKGLTKELETLRSVLASKDQHEETIDELIRAGKDAAAQLKLFDYDSKRRTMFALNVQMTVRKKGSIDDLQFKWQFGEVFMNTMEYLGGSIGDSVDGRHWREGLSLPVMTWDSAEIAVFLHSYR